MIDSEEPFVTWQEVIVDFFENKISKSQLFKARKYINDKDIEIEKEKNIQKLEKLQIKKDEKLVELVELRKTVFKDEISLWLEATITKKPPAEGVRIIKATHVLRFSHSSAENSGLILIEKSNDKLLTTASFNKKLTFDLAHNNGALISISRFLALELSGELIIDLILDDRFDFIESYPVKSEVLYRWKAGFSQLVERRTIKSLDKAKQLYFPVDDCFEQYHLIAPLYSSSMAEEINKAISKVKYGDAQKTVRKELLKGTFSNGIYVKYPSLSVQNFGGAQPQNVSMLNKSRSGKGYLFSTQPPTWQSQLKTPVAQKTLFDKGFSSKNIKTDINYLRDFLMRFERIELSVKDPKRRKWIESWVGNIIDELLFYVATIHELPAGWSDINDIKLIDEYQYLLDPYRDNDVFQMARKNNDWQDKVCSDFSHWLNRQLIGSDKQFTPQAEHTRMWKTLLSQPLREFNENIEMDRSLIAGDHQ